VIRYTPEAIEVARSGDLADERGEIAVSSNGKPMHDGNYIYVWKKRNGEWRVTLYMWNTGEAAG
jgi:ketosteroid isomerase-like protein